MHEVAIPAGMKPWAGGDSAPEDWDGGPVLWQTPHGRDYSETTAENCQWAVYADDPYNIIAYTPRTPTTASEDAAGLREAVLARAEFLEKAAREQPFGSAMPRYAASELRNLAALRSPAEISTEVAVPVDRFANDAAAKKLYDGWSHVKGWVPWIDCGNSQMQDRARRLAADPWRWWAGDNEEEYRLAGPCLTREQAIDESYGDTEPGDVIYLVEAISEDQDDGEGLYPFIETRNHSHVVREEDPEPTPAAPVQAEVERLEDALRRAATDLAICPRHNRNGAADLHIQESRDRIRTALLASLPPTEASAGREAS